MKKLLSLLSVLTISGSTVPTTIAASRYEKENIKNIDINYRQTNNLEKLNRVKRQQNQRTSKNILILTEKLIIDSNNSIEYINSSRRVVQNLETQRILIPVINVGEENQDSIIYTLNNENYGYLRIPVEIRGIDEENQQSYQRNLELVLRTDNLYLQGFIVNNNYYYFNFNNVDMRRQPQSVRNGSVPLLTQIEGMRNYELNRIGPDYRHLLPRSNNNINWNNIYSSFLYLTNNINVNENNVQYLQQNNMPLEGLATSLGRVIFSTSEALRFRNIYNIMHNDIINNNRSVSLTFCDDEIYQILVSWGTESRQYRSLLFNEQNRYQGFEYWFGIDRFIHNIIGNSEFTFINDLTPIDVITEYLRNFNTRVLLGVAFPLTFGRITSNCNNFYGRSSETTEFKKPFWKEQFCDFKPQIKKIEGEVKIVKIINEDIKSKNLKSGDIFVGTTKGLYLILENGTALKAENINAEVTSIKEFGNGNFYVSTKDKKVYFLNTNLLNDEHITAEIIENAESSNLEKELKLNLYINNVTYGDYFYAEEKGRKKVVDLDINITQALMRQEIKSEQEFKQNFSSVSLENYKSNYKAFVKDVWFYDFKLNTSEFKINDWSYKLISSLEDKVGLAYINGKIYSNYRLYMDKKNELHMQIEIWMQGYANGLNNKWMWIWLDTGYHLIFNGSY
ncbi:MAG: hypothetical protein OHM56_01780 [Spiroplasma phoeniceum]|nr:MAG: hypothetical protein OHM57_00860 [Spiroplasma phoeniceum]UZQ30296.1 MAG: hypothetical protein OHM57_01215 [Spiroplasma phoeniceum]UZQ32653.1 MAG: hypothetical protein OHM56_01435 [Spiroplasma phoeniceum]UZQ32716.1 MAG: hypothetical protein OHM56_01780 [Spiroplasma phoeniceum]